MAESTEPVPTSPWTEGMRQWREMAEQMTTNPNIQSSIRSILRMIKGALGIGKGALLLYRPEEQVLEFESLAFPGWGAEVDGWMLRSSYAVSLHDDDHETARQFWTRADGTGERWLGVEYRYERKRTAR